MKAFKFSLESLREPRKQKEQAAQQNYARALAACEKAATKLETATLELKAQRNLLSHELANGAPMEKINSLRAWCEVLEVRRNKCKAAFDEARRASERAFQEMVEASREREALDCFYQKARNAHGKEVQRHEQKILDEIAIRFRDIHLLEPLAVKV